MGILGRLVDRRHCPRVSTWLEAKLRVRSREDGGYLSGPRTVYIDTLADSGCGLALSGLTLGGFHLVHCLEDPRELPVELRLTLPCGEKWVLLGRLHWVNRDDQDRDTPFRAGLRFFEEVGPPGGWRRRLDSSGPGPARTATG